MPAEGDAFREVMGQFPTGVTIVTTRLGDELHGMTANAIASVSLQPPLVLVCIDAAADSHDIVDRAGVFALNILARDQEELSWQFAVKEGRSSHALDDVPHHIRATGAPIIDGSVAYLDCRIVQRLPAGDHTIFIGEVEDAARLNDAEPLVFHRGAYRTLG
ncbi:MAG: flavin reductase family protein [Dehalococcoidia bacterium]